MKKLCVVITGCGHSGKTYIRKSISSSFPQMKIKAEDLCFYIERNNLQYPNKYYSWIQQQINKNEVTLLETHPPYIPMLKSNDKYDVLYLHLYIKNFDQWVLQYKKRLPKRRRKIKLGMFDDFVDLEERQSLSKEYYEGFIDLYALTCTRLRDDYLIFHSSEKAKKYLLNFLRKRVS